MKARIQWSRVTDEQLLNLRICDLPLRLEGNPLMRRVKRLYRELRARGITFRPHVWLSDEFFTPDGVPGFAMPFYLAHPRLMRLERRMMLEVEGGTEEEFMRIIRHEAGHAIDNAYHLHQNAKWRKMFGRVSTPYPESYKPNPTSRSYVLHLGYWYAQAHPLEDYAETFAVWLRPGSRWRSRYKKWAALKKLIFIDQMMKSLSGKRTKNWYRSKVLPLSELKITIREFYRRKTGQYSSFEYPPFLDKDLLRMFSLEKRHAHRPTAASFLRKHRAEWCRIVSEGTGVHAYTVNHVLQNAIERAKELKLRLGTSEAVARRQAMIMLTVHTMNIVHSGHYRFHYGL